MKVYLEEVPPHGTVYGMLKYKLGSQLQEAIADVSSAFSSINNLIFDGELGKIKRLGSQTIKYVEERGIASWYNSPNKKAYPGLSLVYNPNHADGLSPEQSTLGSSFYISNEEKAMPTRRNWRNTYYDTYAFTERTDYTNNTDISLIFDEIESNGFTNIRGRMSVIMPSEVTDKQAFETSLMHRDESIFENLRINIPLFGFDDKDSYGFEIEGYAPYPMEYGKVYSWDTEKQHRPVMLKPTSYPRGNLVMGVSPWFRFDREGKYWEPNEHFGKKHPFALLIDGDIVSGLKLDRMF